MVDDGIRVWVNDKKVIDQWDWNNINTFEYAFDTVAGQEYKIRIEYEDKGFGASCIMRWKGDALGMQDIPKEYMYTEQ